MVKEHIGLTTSVTKYPILILCTEKTHNLIALDSGDNDCWEAEGLGFECLFCDF